MKEFNAERYKSRPPSTTWNPLGAGAELEPECRTFLSETADFPLYAVFSLLSQTYRKYFGKQLLYDGYPHYLQTLNMLRYYTMEGRLHLHKQHP